VNVFSRRFVSVFSARLSISAALYFCLAAGLLIGPGCRRSKDFPRYDLSGSVTYNGKAVPVGSIIFVPDKAQGNDGPGATAAIIDGAYSTQPVRGTIGGPHIVQLSGFDGKPYNVGIETHPMGRMMFSGVKMNVDLPKEPAKHDFVLPQRNK
jgi:hypothetical protein